MEKIRLNENTLPYAIGLVESGMRRKLSQQEIDEIYNEGLPVAFRGGPLGVRRQNYALFAHPFTGNRPSLSVKGHFSTYNHKEFLRRGYPIFAGTLEDDQFDSVSSTWTTKEVDCKSPEYDFGKEVNKAMLNHFGLEY